MLTFAQFHEQAIPVNMETAQYGILYQSNGLGGESGELQNIVKKMVRDGMTDERRYAALIEAGDIMFYMRQLLHEIGFTMEQAAQAELDKLEHMRSM
jgi:hypothetical protein